MGSLRFTTRLLSQGVSGAGTGSAPASLTAIAGLTNVCSEGYECLAPANHHANFCQAVANLGAGSALYGLYVYQGTPMTQAELDAVVYQTDITASPRYSDLLVRCAATFSPASTNNSYAARPTFYPAAGSAIRSGTATWAIVGEWGVNPFLCLLSITGVGGGGDLEIQDTNIQAGVPYLFGKITLTPKLSFSW